MKTNNYIDLLHAIRQEHFHQMKDMDIQDRVKEENTILEQFLVQHQLQGRILSSPKRHEQVA